MGKDTTEDRMADTMAVSNNLTYAQWRTQDLARAVGDTANSHGIYRSSVIAGFILTRDNNRELRSLWGRCNFIYKGEFTHHVWERDYVRHRFLVFSGKKGTSYEVKYDGSFAQFRNGTAIGHSIIDFTRQILADLIVNDDIRSKYRKLDPEVFDSLAQYLVPYQSKQAKRHIPSGNIP